MQSSNWSLENHLEAEMVLLLYDALTRRYPELRHDTSKIGIISPYKAQVAKSHAQPQQTALFTWIVLLSPLLQTDLYLACSATASLQM